MRCDTSKQLPSVHIAAIVGLVASGSGATATQASQDVSTGAPSFEVASVRLNTNGGFNLVGVQARPGGTVEAINVPLRSLIAFAYGLEVQQKIEGKSTLLDQNFDVIAKAALEVPRVPMGQIGPLNLMMQRLLAERFKLVTRWEDRPEQGYVLVRLRPDGPLGPQLRPSDLDCSGKPSGDQNPPTARRCSTRISVNELIAEGPIADLARILSLTIQRRVLDKTGLTGTFAARMTFNMQEFAELRGIRNPSAQDGPKEASLFVAIQEQLGLKLEPQQLSNPTLIVESVEQPSEN